MAANIEIRTIGGEQRESYVGNQPTWHDLGTIYDKPLTAVEALKGCYADFEVGLQPIIAATPELSTLLDGGESSMATIIDGKSFVSVEDLKSLIIESHKATMRLDLNETLGVVGKGYGVLQNSHAFDFIDILTTGKLGGEIPTIESAGVLGNGERIFICAKFPEPIRLLNNSNDIVDNYIVFTTSHDGSGAVTAMCTPIRVVCQNTLNMAFDNNSGKISFKHTSNVMNRVDLTSSNNAEMAYRSLGLYNLYKQEFENQIQQLARIKMNEKQMEEVLVKSVLGPDAVAAYFKHGSLDHHDIHTRGRNIVNNIMEANFSGVGQDIIREKNTGFSLVNAITTYYQNTVDWKEPEKKFNAVMGGSVQMKLQKAYNNIMAIAA